MDQDITQRIVDVIKVFPVPAAPYAIIFFPSEYDSNNFADSL